MIAKCLVRQKTSKIQSFDYIISDKKNLEINSLVLVPFLNKKVEAIVVGFKPFSAHAKKEVIKKLSKGPIITSSQLTIAQKISWEFFSDYSSAIFSFLPKFNKKDLSTIGSKAKISKSKQIQKPLILNADREFRMNYYIQKINKQKQNLILLPKIEDIIELEKLIKKIDPSIRILKWHSGISPKTKAEAWNSIINSAPSVVIATRHGLFLPFKDLDSICIDDPTNFAYFEDQSPRYNALAASKIVSKEYNCELIMGDSIPSPETFAWIKSGKAKSMDRLSSVEIKSTVEFEKIFSDEQFTDELLNSNKVLITGYFKKYLEHYCHDCGNKVILSKENSSCQECNSIRMKKMVFDIERIKLVAERLFNRKASIGYNQSDKIIISSLNDQNSLPKNFTAAIVPYFDYFSSFPFLNFKYKMVKQIMDLKQTGVKSIFLCSSQFNVLADLLEKKQIDQIIFQELKERKKDNLPPFTRVVEFLGNSHELNKIDKIIPSKRWIVAEKSYAFLSRAELKELQNYYQEERLDLKLKLDPPELS